MDLRSFSYGQIIFHSGVILVGISIIALLFGMIFFSIKRKMLKKQLTDKYGF